MVAKRGKTPEKPYLQKEMGLKCFKRSILATCYKMSHFLHISVLATVHKYNASPLRLDLYRIKSQISFFCRSVMVGLDMGTEDMSLYWRRERTEIELGKKCRSGFPPLFYYGCRVKEWSKFLLFFLLF